MELQDCVLFTPFSDLCSKCINANPTVASLLLYEMNTCVDARVYSVWQASKQHLLVEAVKLRDSSMSG